MELDKEIALQIARIEGLERDILARKPDADDAKRPEDMRRARAETVKRTISDLQKRREATIARFDAEIEGYEAELKALEDKRDIDIGGLRSGGGKSPGGRTGIGGLTGATKTAPAKTKGKG